jgi:hypothetical protein
MKLRERIAQYHEDSRALFVLFTEFAAFVATMATLVGTAVLFSLFH